MSGRSRAGMAGVVGAIVAFGVVELVHGLYPPVPSVFVALAQQVVERTPGELVTRGIELLGQADIPVLVTSMIVGALVVAGALAHLGVRRPGLALVGVGALAVVGIAASLAQPFVAPVPTVITILAALTLGVAVTETLLRASRLRAPKSRGQEAAPPGSSEVQPPIVRSREAHSSGGTMVGRRGFLMLGGLAAVLGLAAAGVGRALADRGPQASAAPKPLNLPEKSTSETPEKGAGAEEAVKHETLPPPPKDASIDAPGMVPLITPASSFYLIDTALVSPRIDVNSWKLSV
ncbi:MAG TPA: hypothetical protein VGP74_05605, partial [Rubrobacteraceae bacterium]|nr:hypothetical protein [Rubrobacteraceae bacterium]